MSDLYEPIRRRREKGRLRTAGLLLYILITTVLLLLFRDGLRILSYFNPFMFIHFSFEYLSYTMATPELFPGAVAAILVLSILPVLGWLMLQCKLYAGKYVIQASEIVTIFCNAILLIYMVYTSSAINVMLTFPTYLLLPIASIVLPGLVLASLKSWNPREWIGDQAKRHRGK